MITTICMIFYLSSYSDLFLHNNKDEDDSLKTLNDKNHQAFSQKFRQLIFFFCCICFAVKK